MSKPSSNAELYKHLLDLIYQANPKASQQEATTLVYWFGREITKEESWSPYRSYENLFSYHVGKRPDTVRTSNPRVFYQNYKEIKHLISKDKKRVPKGKCSFNLKVFRGRNELYDAGLLQRIPSVQEIDFSNIKQLLQKDDILQEEEKSIVSKFDKNIQQRLREDSKTYGVSVDELAKKLKEQYGELITQSIEDIVNQCIRGEIEFTSIPFDTFGRKERIKTLLEEQNYFYGNREPIVQLLSNRNIYVEHWDKQSNLLCTNCLTRWKEEVTANTRCHEPCCLPTTSTFEEDVKNWLDTNHINYQRQKTFEKCRSNKGAVLPFDFYLPKFDVLVECDGEQHEKFTSYFHENEDEFKDQQERDKIKDDFAQDRLLRIKWKDRNNIEFILNKKLRQVQDTKMFD